MLSHTDLLLKLASAAQAGEDLWALSESEREHLLSCEQCRQASLTLLGEALGAEQLLLLFPDETESGDAPLEPPGYPVFDFSFLGSAEQDLWASRAEGMGMENGVGTGGGQGKNASQTHVLRYKIEILLGQKAARLGELAAALQPLRFAPVAVRGEREQRPEGLTLEDPEHDMRIAIRLSGQHQLSIRLFSGSAARPGRLALISTDEPKRTLQRLSLRAGEETSLPLTRGDLLVQVEHDQQTWEIPIRVR